MHHLHPLTIHSILNLFCKWEKLNAKIFTLIKTFFKTGRDQPFIRRQWSFIGFLISFAGTLKTSNDDCCGRVIVDRPIQLHSMQEKKLDWSKPSARRLVWTFNLRQIKQNAIIWNSEWVDFSVWSKSCQHSFIIVVVVTTISENCHSKNPVRSRNWLPQFMIHFLITIGASVIRNSWEKEREKKFWKAEPSLDLATNFIMTGIVNCYA